MKIAGVYKITNNITGDFYIGSSKNIERRWTRHKNPSVQAQQPNSRLYKDIAYYGLDNFTFEIIEETDNLKDREQYWIDQLKPSYNNYRAKGQDIERCKEARRRAQKTYRKNHRDECLARMKDWHKANRDKQLAKKKDYYYTNRDECLAKKKAYCSRLCFYEGETLTFGALSRRFSYQGIANPCKEAKKYLL